MGLIYGTSLTMTLGGYGLVAAVILGVAAMFRWLWLSRRDRKAQEKERARPMRTKLEIAEALSAHLQAWMAALPAEELESLCEGGGIVIEFGHNVEVTPAELEAVSASRHWMS